MAITMARERRPRLAQLVSSTRERHARLRSLNRQLRDQIAELQQTMGEALALLREVDATDAFARRDAEHDGKPQAKPEPTR